jgi:hypothetical protein
MSEKQSNKGNARRKLLKGIAAGSGAVIAGKTLPENWSRPVVDSVMLPAHAQTSPPSPVSYYGMSGYESDAAIDTDSHFARAFEGLVNEAHAGNGMMEPMLSAHSCIRKNNDGTFRVDALLNDGYELATFSAESVEVAGSAEIMSGDHCRMYDDLTLLDGLGLIQDAQAGSPIGGGVLVEIDSVNGQAIGRYIIDSKFTLDFDLPPGDCSAPQCPPPKNGPAPE